MSGEPTPTRASRQSKEAEIMSSCKSIAYFKVLDKLSNKSTYGVVVLATCVKPGHPFPWKVYALKAIKNYGADSSRSLHAKYEAEFNIFQRIPRHNRMVVCWTAFTDVIPDEVLDAFTSADKAEMLSAAKDSERLKTMYFVFDYHPETLLSYRLNVRMPVLPWSEFSPIAEQVIEGELFFERVGLAHRDIKLDNVLRQTNGSVCFIDLGEALIVPLRSDGKPNWRVTIARSSTGGNQAHNAPEVSNALKVFTNSLIERVTVDYSGQGVFETGVLLWELATGQHPFGNYPLSVTIVDISGNFLRYDDGVVWESVSKALSPALLGEGYPVEFLPLIRRMTACNPADRLSLSHAAREFEAMCRSPAIGDANSDTIEALIDKQYDCEIMINSLQNETEELRSKLEELHVALKPGKRSDLIMTNWGMCSVAKICVVLLVIVAVLAAVVGGVLWRLRPGTISTYALPSVRNCDGNESMCTETHSARNALTGAVEIGPLRMAVLDNALKGYDSMTASASSQLVPARSEALAEIEAAGRLYQPINATSVQRLVLLMSFYENDGEFQQASCQALSKIGSSGPNRVPLVAGGGHLLLFRAMEVHRDNADVHRHACTAIMNLAVGADTKVTIAGDGGLKRLLAVVDRFTVDASVQCAVWGALWNLVSNPLVSLALVAEEGGLARLYRSMDGHLDSVEMQKVGCGVIWNLGVVDDHKSKLGDDGLPRLFAAMNKHPDNEELHRTAFGALGVLSSTRDNKEKIVAGDRWPALLKAMRAHIGNENVQINVALFLYALAHDSDDLASAAKIVEEGGLLHLVNAMEKHPMNADLHEYGFRVFVNVGFSQRNRERIVAVGGLHSVAVAMANHPGNSKVQHRACAVIWAIASHSENRKKILDEPGLARLFAAMDGYLDNVDVQTEACGALWQLAMTPDIRPLIASQGGLNRYIKAMDRHTGHPELQRRACDVLSTLAVDGDILQQISVEGALSRAQRALSTYANDVNVQAPCGKLLSQLRS